MKNMTTGIIIGLVAGALIAVLAIFFSSPSLMLKENKSKHDFETTLAQIEKSVDSLGWKIPHINDLQATMHKFGKDVRQVKVYEICHPDHAYKVLKQDDERIVSTLMPCRIAIYEKSNGNIYVSRMNSGLMSKPMSKIIRSTMSDAAADTEKILASVIE
ncbi:MAG: DUF302 domain-containing protein [Bacteroidales bacterium]|nr:DUF302 domain-containing protein [Bacteroidales bacterium]MDT8431238.1 DUF302 domain-containing protein [Bacteroidales bacterium]